MRGANSLENALMLGMIEGRRRRQIESTYNAGDPSLIPGLGRSAGEGKKLPTSVFWPGELIHVISKSQRGLSDFHFRFGTSQVALVVKNLPANAGDLGSIRGSGRSPGEGTGNPLRYSCLGKPMDRGAWWPTFHRVAKSRT